MMRKEEETHYYIHGKIIESKNEFNDNCPELKIASQKLLWPEMLKFVGYIENKAILNDYFLAEAAQQSEIHYEKLNLYFKDLFPEYFI